MENMNNENDGGLSRFFGEQDNNDGVKPEVMTENLVSPDGLGDQKTLENTGDEWSPEIEARLYEEFERKEREIHKMEMDRRDAKNKLWRNPKRIERYRGMFDVMMNESRMGDPWVFLHYIGYTDKKKTNPDGTLKVRTRTEITPELEQRVKDLKSSGMKSRQIMEETKLSESSVSKILNGTREIVGRN